MKKNNYETKPKIIIHEAVMIDYCQLGVRVGTTGFCGGDAGHGGRTVFELNDLTCGGDIDFEVLDHGARFRCELRGDAELRTFRDALAFALARLDGKLAEDAPQPPSDAIVGDVL